MVISSGKQHERSNTHSKHQKIPWYASGMFLLERTRWTIWYCRDPRHHRMLQGAVRRAGGKNQPTKLQAATIDKIRQAGGTASVVRSVDDVRQIIEGLEV